MRKIKIENNRDLLIVNEDKYVMCPCTSTASYLVNCMSHCAWFHIDTIDLGEINGKELAPIKKLAYCKDHCIGEIIE